MFLLKSLLFVTQQINLLSTQKSLKKRKDKGENEKREEESRKLYPIFIQTNRIEFIKSSQAGIRKQKGKVGAKRIRYVSLNTFMLLNFNLFILTFSHMKYHQSS